MVAADAFSWLSYESRPGAWMAVASLFAFLRGVSASALIDRAGLPGVEEVDWSAIAAWDDPFAEYGLAAYDDPSGWTVFYGYNSYPEAFLNQLLVDPTVTEAVVLFWNVNGASEFSYWEAGRRLCSFQEPDARYGSKPDALAAAITRASTIEAYELAPDTDEPVYWRALLALAADVTGVVITPDFL
jgi:hypothetical protein